MSQTGTITLIGGMNLKGWANRRVAYFSVHQRREIIRKWVNEFGDRIMVQINPDIHPDICTTKSGENMSYERPPAAYNNIPTYKYNQ